MKSDFGRVAWCPFLAEYRYSLVSTGEGLVNEASRNSRRKTFALGGDDGKDRPIEESNNKERTISIGRFWVTV